MNAADTSAWQGASSLRVTSSRVRCGPLVLLTLQMRETLGTHPRRLIAVIIKRTPTRARARERLIIVEFRPGRWALPHHRDMAPFIPLWNECRRDFGLPGHPYRLRIGTSA